MRLRPLSVTLIDNTIDASVCPGGPGPGPGGAAIPTLSAWAMILLAALLAGLGFAATRRLAA